MINITNKVDCCGCNACGDVCPAGAISFETDIEGFWYPKVDRNKCFDCGLCEKTCPLLNASALKSERFETPLCYGANHKNLEIRFDSTSGGVFTAIAEHIYKQDGYVGGAVYREDFSAYQMISDDKNDLCNLRSSKYLQSDATGFYRAVKASLATSKQVVVCGTPCQIFALYRYLGKNYENLTTLDFICHSVASPKAHRKYFDYLEEIFGSRVVSFKAKNKELGWRNLTKKSTFANGKSYYGIKGQDCYNRAYHSGMISRPSCYSCPFKGFPRIADISLGDFWGIEHSASELDDNIGTSVVFINSAKGRDLFTKVSQKLIIKNIQIKDIVPYNPALIKPAAQPRYDRNSFFCDLDKLRFDCLTDKYMPIDQNNNPLHRIIDILRTFISMTQLRPKAMVQFFNLNFFHPAIHTDWKHGHLLYPTPYCVFNISKKSKIIVKGTVKLGLKKISRSKIESRFFVGKNSRLVFEGNFRFGYGCDVEIFDGAELICGKDSGGNIGLTLICGNKIVIGDHTFYGRDVSIRDTNGGHIIAMQGFKNTNPVIIGNLVWLCSGCSVMPGVKIGDGSVVGAHSVVNTSLPSNTLASGFPARVIDIDIKWKH